MNREILKKELWNITNSRANLKSKIQFYTELIKEMGGNDYSLDGMPRGSKTSNPVLDYIISTERYRIEIQKAQEKLDGNIQRFESMLAVLDENEQAILRLRYMRGIRWEYFNQYTPYYSRRQAVRVHNRAVDKILKRWHEMALLDVL